MGRRLVVPAHVASTASDVPRKNGFLGMDLPAQNEFLAGTGKFLLHSGFLFIDFEQGRALQLTGYIVV